MQPSVLFEGALAALLGKDAGGLSASTIGRLKEAWSDEHARWSKRGRVIG
jgi:putative transposase